MKVKKDEKDEKPVFNPLPLAVKELPKPDIARLLVRAAEISLRAITETTLLHGMGEIYNDAQDALKEIQAVQEAHKP